MPVKRKKHGLKKCKDCKHFNRGWCDIFYSRHDAMTPRCKKDYVPLKAWYTNRKLWLLILLVIVTVVCIAVKMTGG